MLTFVLFPQYITTANLILEKEHGHCKIAATATVSDKDDTPTRRAEFGRVS